jgi:hypothetical protein
LVLLAGLWPFGTRRLPRQPRWRQSGAERVRKGGSTPGAWAATGVSS